MRYFVLKLALLLVTVFQITTFTANAAPTFPPVSLSNLEGNLVSIPTQKKKYTIVIMAFDHELQSGINPWLDWLQKVKASNTLFDFYEIPVVDKKYNSYRKAIEFFMKRQLKKKIFYSKTLPYFASPENISQQYSASTGRIELWVMNASGNILYRTNNQLTESKKSDILSYLK